MNTSSPEYITHAEACRRLSCGRPTLTRLRKPGGPVKWIRLPSDGPAPVTVGRKSKEGITSHTFDIDHGHVLIDWPATKAALAALTGAQ